MVIVIIKNSEGFGIVPQDEADQSIVPSDGSLYFSSFQTDTAVTLFKTNSCTYFKTHFHILIY
jgi:hypothetical protein